MWFDEVPDPTDPQNYDRSELRARQSSHGLHAIFNTLSQKYNVLVFAHSMGNIVVSEALRNGDEADSGIIVNTYIASQAASVAHAYDAQNPETVESDFTTDTPEVYADYPETNLPYYTGVGNSAVTIINFHNIADKALSGWEINQDWKPDSGWDYNDEDWLRYGDPVDTYLSFPEDRYEIYAHIAEARSRALGAEGNTGNEINGGGVNLNIAQFAYGDEKHEHSAQFGSNNMRRQFYWENLLLQFGVITE